MDDSAALAAATPVRDDERIQTLDILRGAALLGILLMNILAFGLPMAAYSNPTIAGGSTGPNLWAWILQWILFEGKMRGIFSIMFGAGIYLLTSRVEARGGPAADVSGARAKQPLASGAAMERSTVRSASISPSGRGSPRSTALRIVAGNRSGVHHITMRQVQG